MNLDTKGKRLMVVIGWPISGIIGSILINIAQVATFGSGYPMIVGGAGDWIIAILLGPIWLGLCLLVIFATAGTTM